MGSPKNYFLFTVLLLLLSGLIISCGGGSDDGSSSGARESVTVRGTVSDSMASIGSESDNMFATKIKEFLTLVQSSYAQEGQVLEGILVEAFDGEIKVGEDITDSSGEFVINEVPCEVPLTLVFTYEENEVILDGVSVPCLDMTDEGVISMVVSLNFSEGEGEVEEIEEEESIMDAALSCTTDDEEIDMNGEEFMLGGEGNACIITAGNCNLSIRASSVVLKNCSTCIDTRGGSSVQIDATDFDCVSNHDGVKSAGNSLVDITVITSEMTDDTVLPSEAQVMNHLGDDTIVGSGDGNILIITGEDGADIRGTSNLNLHAFADGTQLSSELRGDITIDAVTNGIIAVGNAGAELESETCTVEPDTTTKGNADVELNCVQ